MSTKADYTGIRFLPIRYLSSLLLCGFQMGLIDYNFVYPVPRFIVSGALIGQQHSRQQNTFHEYRTCLFG